MSDGHGMHGRAVRQGLEWRTAVWALLCLSLATWLFTLAGFGPNPERMPITPWRVLAWIWPLCALVLLKERRPRWAWRVLAATVILFSACMLFFSLMLGRGRHLNALKPIMYSGHPVRLAVENAHSILSTCQEATVVLAGGWVLQRLNFSACNGHDSMEFLDADSFALEPGPTADTFALSIVRTQGDNGPKRVRIGVYRIGLGGRLVRVAGGDHDGR